MGVPASLGSDVVGIAHEHVLAPEHCSRSVNGEPDAITSTMLAVLYIDDPVGDANASSEGSPEHTKAPRVVGERLLKLMFIPAGHCKLTVLPANPFIPLVIVDVSRVFVNLLDR